MRFSTRVKSIVLWTSHRLETLGKPTSVEEKLNELEESLQEASVQRIPSKPKKERKSGMTKEIPNLMEGRKKTQAQ